MGRPGDRGGPGEGSRKGAPRTEEAPRQRARALALRLLESRPRSEAQIRARLAQEGLSGEATEVVAWLQRLGYLDDTALAKALAASALAPGKYGPRKAEERLLAAGITAQAAKEAVREALLGEEGRKPWVAEQDLCRTLAERRGRGKKTRRRREPQPPEKRCSACAEFLAGRKTQEIPCIQCGTPIYWPPESQLQTHLGNWAAPALCGACKLAQVTAAREAARHALRHPTVAAPPASEAPPPATPEGGESSGGG